MFLTAKPHEQGKFCVITGPVDSDKTRIVAGFLDAAVDSGYKKGGNIMVFRHPADDKNPERIGKHEVRVTESVDGIYEGILPQTRTVVIAGVSRFSDRKIVELADEVVRSDRDLIISGLNLDGEGKPYGYMPELIALADEVYLAKAICSSSGAGCRSGEATRSVKKEEKGYRAVCAHHFHYPECPPVSGDVNSYVGIKTGPMFSGKTTSWHRGLEKMKQVGWEPLVLKYLGDNRDGEKEVKPFEIGYVTLHSEERIPAILVGNVEQIRTCLEEHPRQKEVFLNEGQFFPGLYELVYEYIPKGRRFHVDALLRGFNRRKFGEIAELICLADKVETYYATCVKCGHPAAENQRMKRVRGEARPAHIDDPLELIGGRDKEGAEYFYEARCLEHWVLDGEPPLHYKLSKFEWGKR